MLYGCTSRSSFASPSSRLRGRRRPGLDLGLLAGRCPWISGLYSKPYQVCAGRCWGPRLSKASWRDALATLSRRNSLSDTSPKALMASKLGGELGWAASARPRSGAERDPPQASSPVTAAWRAMASQVAQAVGARRATLATSGRALRRAAAAAAAARGGLRPDASPGSAASDSAHMVSGHEIE